MAKLGLTDTIQIARVDPNNPVSPQDTTSYKKDWIYERLKGDTTEKVRH